MSKNGNAPIRVSPFISNGGLWNTPSNLQWSPDSSQLAFQIAYSHAVATSSLGMIELYSVLPDGSALQKLSQRDMPAVLDGNLNLGVRQFQFQFQFQGDSELHQ